MQALQGVKVLDLTRLLPGPYASMILGDFGAEVIKVEQPGEGDYARTYQPLINGTGYRFLILNRNKKSISLDLKKPEGKEIFLNLVKEADVVMEGFRPGVMKRLGVDYDTLKEINPRIIFCSMTGFGQTGPYKMDAGHDLNYISLAGITSLTGQKLGQPYIPGIQIADISGGLMAALGILLALQSRNATGVGQNIDISLFNAALAMLPSDASVYLGSGQVSQRGETRLTGGWANYFIYRTKDGRYMAVGALEMKFWKNFCTVIDREDLIGHIEDDSKKEALYGVLEEIFLSKTAQEWEDLLLDKDTCITLVKNIDEVFADPHVIANEMVVDMHDEKLGDYKQIGFPIKLSGTPGQFSKKYPELGENTDEILKQAGYSQEAIDNFRKTGVV